MEYAVLGWPDDDPTLRLDHRAFSYAGKFVMSNTGKAVVRDEDAERATGGEDAETPTPETDAPDRDWVEDDRIVAAVAFNEDRTDSAAAWLRYVTVRRDRRGAGLGARLCRFAAARLRERGYERVRIAVNNPFAFHALYKAGFGYTGEETGLAELVLVAPSDRPPEAYRTGLDAYREREGLSAAERDFLAAKADADPPPVVADPG
ncbi:GNAT family N-acetyltransferase [Halorussus gelatinilyticus]|uniref:GNAT family N-acetyltransferase n=1 Tax=Halorussus gelatinilyticus TaxID=2937524 RepID=A0A8U0IH59_9EURY|nr:GNAT family N-acetyltransferase [Halorussus gelatinilyticus]UPV99408.1 GNAT family N-acetyltransferase [Halorussus gelatinilyticus]